MHDFDVNAYVAEQLAKSKDNGFTCVEAEANILRRMILKQGVAEELAMELVPGDFSNFDYGRIFKAVQALVSRQKQVDIVSIDAEMTRLYGANWKPETLVSLTQQTDFTVAQWQDVRDHIQIVRDLSRRRQAIASLEGLVAGLRDPTKDVSATLSEISEAADKIDTGEAEWVNISEVLLSTYDYVDRRQKGEIKAITTGISSLDRMLGGFFAGELSIIAARPSVGKSAFGANVALAAARNGFHVGIASCEMDKEAFGQRLLSHGSYVDGMRFRRADLDEEAWGKVVDAMSDMSELPIEFLFDCNTAEDIVKTARKLARRGELDMLIVDYLQFMDTRRRFKEERFRIGYMTKLFKRLAQKAKIPVLLLSQLTRQGEGAMPTMKMLRESGDIEQDADGILFLHRPDNPNDASVDPRDRAYIDGLRDRGLTYLCIGVAKQRNGSIGQANVLFNASIMRYSEIARE